MGKMITGRRNQRKGNQLGVYGDIRPMGMGDTNPGRSHGHGDVSLGERYSKVQSVGFDSRS